VKRTSYRASPSAAATLAALAGLLLSGCSFDYGSLSEESDSTIPDLVMTDVEYVRVQDGKPVVRLQAAKISRYDKDKRMEVEFPRFAQYAADGSEGSRGGASSATVDIESGDVVLSGGVVLSVPGEDVHLETDRLDWLDKDRVLAGGDEVPLLVKRGDGSYLSGPGFRVDSRSKRWSFSGAVSGTYVDEADESADESGEPAAGSADEAPSDASAQPEATP
jgi:LPS export ABC transporter protein LptC